MTCSCCGTEFEGAYYHVAGTITCARCAEKRLARQRAVGPRLCVESVATGVVAAVAGGVLSGWLFARLAVVNRTAAQYVLSSLVRTTVEAPAFYWLLQMLTPFLIGLLVIGAMLLITHGRSCRTMQCAATAFTVATFVVSHVTIARSFAAVLAGMGHQEHLFTAGAGPHSIGALLGDTVAVPWLLVSNDPTNIPAMVVPFLLFLPAVWQAAARDETAVMGPYAA